MINVLVAIILTAAFRAMKLGNGTDITRQADYFADIGDPGVETQVSEDRPIH